MESPVAPKDKRLVIIAIVILALLVWGAFSLKKANAPVDSISPEVGFIGYSPKGFLGGAIVPASCESGYSHAGECFDMGGNNIPIIGGYIEITPQCPCNSAPNSCGMTNPGFGACGGVCPMPVPEDTACSVPFLSVGYTTTIGGGDPASGGSSGGTDPITITSPLSSQTVNKGQKCTIQWSASPATSCTVTGGGLNYTGAASGQIETPPINATSVFTIKCYNGSVSYTDKNFTCRLNPVFEETR